MSKIKTPRTLSPYLLIQEFLRDKPWQLLTACIMLNQTTAKQVWKILPNFLERYPDPETFLIASEAEVKQLIRSLGFVNRRYERLQKMTADFIDYQIVGAKLDPENLHGIGKYASDSYRIFCEGYLLLDVLDKELKRYVRWAQEQAGRDEAHHGGSGRIQRHRETGARIASEPGGEGEGQKGR
jgi:endonuclease III